MKLRIQEPSNVIESRFPVVAGRLSALAALNLKHVHDRTVC